MNQEQFPTRWPRGRPLPNGWSAPLLSEVAHRDSGHTPDKNVPEYWNGAIKWLSLTDCDRLNRVYVGDTYKTITDAGIANSSAHLLPRGVVVLSRDAGVGQSAITTSPMAVSQHFLAWQCSEKLDSHFLYYWFQYLRPELERIAMGSTIKTIGLPYFDRMRVPLPPLSVQRMIAQALLACDSTVFCLERLAEAKTVYRRGLRQKLLTSEKRFAKFAGHSWGNTALGTMVESVSRRNSIGVGTVLSASGEHGLVDQRRYFNKTVAGEDISNYYLLRRGEFAYNRSSMKGYPFGATKRLDEYDEGALSTLYTCFRIKQERLNSDFAVHLFESGLLDRQLRRITKVGGRAHGLLNVTASDYFAITIPLPPLDEQRCISTILNDCAREIDLLERLQHQLAIQKRAIFARMLAGKSSVPA